MNTKATLYLDAQVYRALKVKAALSDQTVSETANALISHGLLDGVESGYGSVKTELRLEGKLGFPVLSLEAWPKNYVFNREDSYD
ncbi:MAG TPA: hypothetical protein VK914_12905 [bacterium]|jgi:hypothetical protein|nr:hypothetical protein [bacterium]